VSGKFTAYVADPLGDLDAGRFGLQIGSCTGQQTWECLALLVAPLSLVTRAVEK